MYPGLLGGKHLMGFAILAVHNNNGMKTKRVKDAENIYSYGLCKNTSFTKNVHSMDFLQRLSNQSVASFRPYGVDEIPRIAEHGSQRQKIKPFTSVKTTS